MAITATLFAAEAFALRNVWWALPANAFYLMSYFMILFELNVEEPQYYSIGAALLGMLMHFLLTRAGSKTGAFIAGMLSQLVLLGTTYIQMVSTNRLSFFFVLFVQSMIVLIYGTDPTFAQSGDNTYRICRAGSDDGHLQRAQGTRTCDPDWFDGRAAADGWDCSGSDAGTDYKTWRAIERMEAVRHLSAVISSPNCFY